MSISSWANLDALAFEMFDEKTPRGFIELNLVFCVLEPMPLVVLDHVFNMDPTLTQSLQHLVTFTFVNPRVVSTLSNQ